MTTSVKSDGHSPADFVLLYLPVLSTLSSVPYIDITGVLISSVGYEASKTSPSHASTSPASSASFAAIKDVLEKGTIILPLDYYATNGKKQMTGMMAAPIVIGTDSFICVVVVIYNLQEKRLYLHECFLTEKNPEIAASSLVRDSSAASPQSQGSVAKILQKVLNTK